MNEAQARVVLAKYFSAKHMDAEDLAHYEALRNSEDASWMFSKNNSGTAPSHTTTWIVADDGTVLDVG